jgi:hypothetical protein
MGLVFVGLAMGFVSSAALETRPSHSTTTPCLFVLCTPNELIDHYIYYTNTLRSTVAYSQPLVSPYKSSSIYSSIQGPGVPQKPCPSLPVLEEPACF